MKSLNRVWLVMLLILPMPAATPCRAQTEPQTTDKSIAATPETDAQKNNLQVYVELLRKDVRQQKAEIMGAVMVLSADDAAKFWPIYSDYDAQLTKLAAWLERKREWAIATILPEENRPVRLYPVASEQSGVAFKSTPEKNLRLSDSCE